MDALLSDATHGQQLSVAIVVPTLNAGSGWPQWLDAMATQNFAADSVLVIDSSSTDMTSALAASCGFRVVTIERSEFDHGGTRQYALQFVPDAEIVIFLTQDALLASPDSIRLLCQAFADDSVGVAYGRQLPHRDAGPLGAHARLFNYPDVSVIRNIDDIPRLGIKTAFTSNSFAAYRRKALDEVGGFPAHLILGEDMVVAARMVLKGWRVAYVADAKVYHSHDYTMPQEFRRYFDIGVLHAREFWLLEKFGKPEGEGGRFVRSEQAYLMRHAPWLLPSALLRTLLKYAGYRLGRVERRLPLGMRRFFSMHKGFWRALRDDR